VRRTWRHDRPALAVAAAGSLIATIGWRATTRPMGDTPSYRATAAILQDGWPTITERGPGYPLLLIATGADDGSSSLLFFVQLALHVAAIVAVVDLARRASVGARGRIALAALLVSPVVMVRVVHEGTEALAAALLTAIGYLVLTPPARRWLGAVGLGGLCGALALVRPNFAPLALLAAALAAWRWRPLEAPAHPPATRRARWTVAALVATPALLLVVGYAALNGARFDSFGLTPLTAYHLSSRTAPYVEELPERYEPVRSILIAERDAALLRGEEFAPDNFIWEARDELAEATGYDDRELERYLMEIDLHLISHHPLDYLATVRTASLTFVEMDAQPAVLGLGRPVAWAQQGVHLVLQLAFVVLVGMLPGLRLARRVPDRAWHTAVVAAALGIATWLPAVAAETGTPRLRSPAEPLLALLLVVAASAAHRTWRTERGRRSPA
jgi:hypothetical protein